MELLYFGEHCPSWLRPWWWYSK